MRHLCRTLDLAAARSGAAIRDVVIDGVVEQHGVLRHDADGCSQTVLGQVADILTIDRDAPCIDIVEAVDQARQRRFSRPTVADHRDLGPRRDLEIQSVQDPAFRLIAKVHPLEADLATGDLQRCRIRRITDLRLALEQLEYQIHVGQRVLDLAIDDAEKTERNEQLQQERIE